MATNAPRDPKNNLWDFTAYYLRYLRVQKSLSGDDLGAIIKCSKATVSRIENGIIKLDGKQAAQIDRTWKTGGLFGLLVWYAAIGHDPQWFAQYVDLEARAEMIRIFEAQVIPGLLQTEEYAYALLTVGTTRDPDRILHDRLQRQTLLNRDPAPFMTVLLSQNVLEWPIGSPEIMKAQLARLLEMAEQRNVAIRVVPRTWETGAYAGLDGSFSLMSADDYGEVAYAISPETGRLVSAPSDVRSYAVRYDLIGAKALPEAPSKDLIREAMERIP
ncbi:helix-turn-helix transcriptional regulator [Actinomadura adrarensis]|uniref:Helix-turn-helix transcriptional regulator n=1 Tax=Actinomadura adrarensis TaxID=1819600 RepID=A0ABW3CRP4_9ACTN